VRSAGAFTVPGQVADDSPDERSVTTWLLDDPTNPDARTLVARTRITGTGIIETQVAGRFFDCTELLGLHRGLVEQALARRPRSDDNRISRLPREILAGPPWERL